MNEKNLTPTFYKIPNEIADVVLGNSKLTANI